MANTILLTALHCSDKTVCYGCDIQCYGCDIYRYGCDHCLLNRFFRRRSKFHLMTSSWYTMGGVPLSVSNEEKDLGVQIDSSLNFDKHIGLKQSKSLSCSYPRVIWIYLSTCYQATVHCPPIFRVCGSSVESTPEEANLVCRKCATARHKDGTSRSEVYELWAAITSTKSSHFAV